MNELTKEDVSAKEALVDRLRFAREAYESALTEATDFCHSVRDRIKAYIEQKGKAWADSEDGMEFSDWAIEWDVDLTYPLDGEDPADMLEELPCSPEDI